MGVQGLWQLLQPTGRPVSLQSLEGKILGVDVSIWLHQAVKGMRDRDGSPLQNAHLHVLFTRICKLLYYKIKPIFVFDGTAPLLKKQTLASRREKKQIAEVEGDKVSKKLLDNLLKSHAVKEALGNKSQRTPKDSSPVKPSSSAAKSDMFQLPPVPEEFTRVQELQPWEEHFSQTSIFEDEFQNIDDIDVDSPDFKSLPHEIQHEILTELREKKKRLSLHTNIEMPKDSGDFSNFQMEKILKQSQLLNKLDQVRKEMNTQASGEITRDLEDDFFNTEITTKRIVSDDNSHFILIRGLSKKRKLEELAKIEEKREKTKEEEECIAMDNNSCEINRSDSKEINDKNDIHSENYKQVKVNSENFMHESVLECGTDESDLTEVSQMTGVSKVPKSQCLYSEMDRSDLTNQTHKSTTDCLISTTDKSELSCESDISNDQCLHSNKSDTGECVITINSVGDGSNFLKDSVRDFSKSPSIMVTEGEQLSNMTVRDDTSPKVENPEQNFNLKNSEKGRTSSEISTKTSEKQTGKESDSESDDEGFIEVLIDPDKAGPDELFPAEIFKTMQPLEIPTSIKDSPSPQHPVNLDPPQTSTDSDIVILDPPPTFTDDDYSDKARDLVQQFQGLSEAEINSVSEELETESRSLQQERGMQERLAMSITEQMYKEAQDLLRLFGVPYLVSPTEAEAQCAQLDKNNYTHGTITDDSDIWLFGGKRVYKNFFNQDRTVELFREESIKCQLGLSREILINIAMLCGSDYTDGIAGVGPVTAMEILSQFPASDITSLISFKSWWIEEQKRPFNPNVSKIRSKLRKLEISEGFPDSRVVDAYLKPTVDDSDEAFSWAMPDLDLLREYAASKLGWTRGKTDDTLLPVMQRLRDNQVQTRINSFFQPENFMEPKQQKSVRLKRAINKLKSSPQKSNSDTQNSQQEEEDAQKCKAVESVKKAKLLMEMEDEISKQQTHSNGKSSSKCKKETIEKLKTVVGRTKATGRQRVMRGKGRRLVKGSSANRPKNSKYKVMEEVNLSESSSDSSEDDQLLAQLDYESWMS